MDNEGVGAWPHRRARLWPERTALVFRGERRSYAELDERTTRLAHVLRDLGVRRGDRVALLSPNHPAHLEVLFAAGLLGAVHVPLNSRLTAAEVAFALQDSGAVVLVHSAEVADIAEAAAAEAGTPRRLAFDGPGADYEERIAAASPERLDEPVELGEPCFIMYTSGTTGRPKGVVLTHGTVTFAVLNPVLDLDLARDEVALVCAPLFHTAALNFVALPTLLKGGAVRIEEGFEPGAVLAAIEQEGVTFTFGVPTMLDALSAHPDWASADLSSLRRVVVAAAPVPERTLRTYTARGIPICQGYGLTETGTGALVLTADRAESRLGSAGLPHFFSDVRLADPLGEPPRPGERGEIQIRGPHVTREYWNRPDATAEAFTEDGWFRSGDVGVADADGFISVVDRMKDMIISGGENIYPAEVENVLLEMPGVAGCAVFGVPDEKWGEVGVAAVTPEPGAELTAGEITGFLAERLAKYKIPKSVVLVADIPRTASGKIRKHELRERYG